MKPFTFENIGDVDFLSELHFNTFLSVKLEHRDKKGQIVYVNYAIPRERKDGTVRLYGDIITYFRNKKGFRFARGFFLEETTDGKMHFGQMQYLYFDLRKATFEKKEANAIYLSKKKNP